MKKANDSIVNAMDSVKQPETAMVNANNPKEIKGRKNGGKKAGIHGDGKVSLVNTIRFRFLLLVFGCVVISAGICYLIMAPKFEKQEITTVRESMKDLSKAYSTIVDQKMGGMGDYVETNTLKSLLKDVHIQGVEGSYVYLVRKDGTVLYHPVAEKVGQPVENAAIKDVVNKLSKGEKVKDDVISYKYSGETKYAGYTISQQSGNIVILTASKEAVLASIRKAKRVTLQTEVIVCPVLLLIAYIFAGSIITGIRRLALVFDKAAKLDLQEDDNLNVLLKRKDEIGLIALKYDTMQSNLKEIVHRINQTSEYLVQSSDKVSNIITGVKEHSEENSATSEELAAGMQETTANVDVININVSDIEENTNRIKDKTMTGTQLASTIKERAVELEEDTIKATEKANAMYKDVKTRSEQAIMKSKAVEKIEMLSSSIMDIADQTSLLALNASIEAARAGELGKGFGVVANEISTLANQSATTVSDISAIVADVTDAVTSISECLEKTLRFFEKDVKRDYDNFRESSLQYSEDAKEIQTSMDNIDIEITALSELTNQIASAVSGIATTMNESSVGVTHIAEKTSDVVGLVAETSIKVEENEKYAKDLKQIVSEFVL